MKSDTWVLFSKGLCYTIIGGVTPLTTGLGQWIDVGTWPPGVNWVVIIAGCLVGAATQLLAFLSQSYGVWKTDRNGNGGAVPPPPKP